MRRNQSSDRLKSTAVPVLATVGVLLLIPAIWAVLVLVGFDGIPGAHRADSRTMATAMLACWPVSICLLAAAMLMLTQVSRRGRRKVAR